MRDRFCPYSFSSLFPSFYVSSASVCLLFVFVCLLFVVKVAATEFFFFFKRKRKGKEKVVANEGYANFSTQSQDLWS